jgi:hypothetical protein
LRPRISNHMPNPERTCHGMGYYFGLTFMFFSTFS